MLRGAHRFSQDLAAAPNTGTKQIPVAKGLGALAEGSVQLALFHPFRPDGDQPERDGVLPVLIEPGEESLAVGATIELGNVMREGAILQVCRSTRTPNRRDAETAPGIPRRGPRPFWGSEPGQCLA